MAIRIYWQDFVETWMMIALSIIYVPIIPYISLSSLFLPITIPNIPHFFSSFIFFCHSLWHPLSYLLSHINPQPPLLSHVVPTCHAHCHLYLCHPLHPLSPTSPSFSSFNIVLVVQLLSINVHIVILLISSFSSSFCHLLLSSSPSQCCHGIN